MATQNDFLPFATGPGANVVDQATYAALSALTTGFLSGTAQSTQLNKVWRQSSIMSAVIAQFIVAQTGQAAVDDGTTAALLANFTNAVKAAATGRLIGTQVFTGSGTYTPTPGMTFVIFEVQGGGASGGGATVPSAGNVSVGSPGTAGAYARGKFTAAQVGASQAVTVGAGAPGQTGGGGLNGGTSSVGSLISAVGGVGGTMLNNAAAPAVNGNGNFATTVTGANLFSSSGTCASLSLALSGSIGAGAPGGSSLFGAGGYGVATNSTGTAALNSGAGGGGVVATSAATGSLSGGAGRSGIVIAWEYA
ncbi:hypothetical protein [Burkholderia multivorans]|uniref:hypothetical protein n=1 Tax=Burkholderia multivorans TaxID=87883 RepID=UPI0020B3FA98|nr:hypothetical protein [Burkholderia multivorans]